ncbi:MAG: type III-B CRISPR-associated protein Cas10/Cmr2, partial [bacterium]
YDHLVQTSAIASALDNISLLSVSLSPVQSFIQNSKKTKDLFSSSLILSYLIFKIMLNIIDKYGPDSIIYPNMLRQPLLDKFVFEKLINKYNDINELKKYLNIDNEEFFENLKIANIPNKFLAIIPFDESIIYDINKTFENELKIIADSINSLGFKVPENIITKIIEDFKDYFNLNSVLLPMYNFEKNDDEIYKHALEDYKKIVNDNKSELIDNINKIIEYSLYKSNDKKDKLGNIYPILVELNERLLNVKKTIKKLNFIELKGNKCNLCGVYEVINLDWKKLYESNVVSENEKLCGICLVKRLFDKIYLRIIYEDKKNNKNIAFPSVSEISTIRSKIEIFEKSKQNKEFKNKILDFINKIEELNIGFIQSETVPQLNKKYKNHELKDLLKIDGQFLMEETFSKEYLKSEYSLSKIDDNLLNSIKNIINEINKEVKINRYYAILLMDGDNMGKWLRGEFNPNINQVISQKFLNYLKNNYLKNNDEINEINKINKINKINEILGMKHPMSPSIHSLFSRRLTEFALSKVRYIIEEMNYGKLVYAGGDDVLALLPVDTVLRCAYYIKESFRDLLGNKATMSAGILITHHKYPFYLALKQVKKLENEAKENRKCIDNQAQKKNSFALGFLTHSGSIRTFVDNWNFINNLFSLINYFKNEEIPSTLPYQLLNFTNSIFDSNNENNNLCEYLFDIFKTELKRLLYHKKINKEVFDFIYNEVLPKLLRNDINDKCKNKLKMIYNFINLLIISSK